MPDNLQENTKVKRLIFQSHHRGSKEMDMLMGQFCDNYIAKLTPAELDLYAELLDENDADIYHWIISPTTCPHTKYEYILEKMRSYTPYVKRQK